MFIEFHVDSFYTDQEIKDTLKEVKSKYSVASVLINENQLRLAKYHFHENSLNIYIDYPLGISSSYIRLKKIEKISGKGKTVSIQAPSHHLINRKYDKIRKEISDTIDLLPDTEIRYILDYRKYNHAILVKFCSILKEYNLHTIYPSTGFFIDNIYDNILASKYLEKKSKIKSILNGNIWTKDHVDLIIKSKPVAVSVQHIHSLYLLQNHQYNDIDTEQLEYDNTEK